MSRDNLAIPHIASFVGACISCDTTKRTAIVTLRNGPCHLPTEDTKMVPHRTYTLEGSES